ncbi:MAG: tyrosine-type recombinase/integrase [Deltaproteobacteria bacterium]|nr:tyrosine-type recombinase/integrase [Deltaproteobacteria bacterium]
MLERYFLKPATIDRLRASWIAEPVERYVAWLTAEGYASRNVFRRVPIIVRFGEFARRRGAKTWRDLPEHVGPFGKFWLEEHGRNYPTARQQQWAEDEARNPVQQMLRLILPEYRGIGRRPRVQDPFTAQAPGFFRYLREERGLKPAAIYHYAHYLRAFEGYLGSIGLKNLQDLYPAVLGGYVTQMHARGRCTGKSTLATLCSTLRVFLRYLHRERVIARDLSSSVEGPQKYRLSGIPRSISWDEVRRMLEAVDRRTAKGRRDYAMLLLLVTYGLRGGEVAHLTLDHIDWKRERLRVPDRKAGHSTAYPLSPIVGEAILDYLRNGRPETSDRHIFLRVVAPRTPITQHVVGLCASQYIRKAGISVVRPGSHTLRHTCVQRLVDAHFSLKTIGDYVGHRSPDSTEIYTKLDVESLREVALGPGEEIS